MCWVCWVYPAIFWQIHFFCFKGLGANGLAALNLAIPVYSFIHGSGLMVGIGGGAKYAVQKGRGDDAGACRAFANAFYVCGAVLAVCCYRRVFQSRLHPFWGRTLRFMI